jgi:hypothetical protein
MAKPIHCNNIHHLPKPYTFPLVSSPEAISNADKTNLVVKPSTSSKAALASANPTATNLDLADVNKQKRGRKDERGEKQDASGNGYPEEDFSLEIERGLHRFIIY